MDLEKEIKKSMAFRNLTIEDLTKKVNKITQKKYSSKKLLEKITQDKMKWKEAKIIAEILGYELEFIKKK